LSEVYLRTGRVLWSADWGSLAKDVLIVRTSKESADAARTPRGSGGRPAKLVKLTPNAQSTGSAGSASSSSNVPKPQGSGSGDAERVALDPGFNPLAEVSCPNPNCFVGVFVPGVDEVCDACGGDVRVSIKQQIAVAKQKSTMPESAGIHMPSLRLHQLAPAKLAALQISHGKSEAGVLRTKAIALEKRARQLGFAGHLERTENDPQYADQMELQGFPAHFCDDVLPELANFEVWANAKRPESHPIAVRPVAKRPAKAVGSKAKGKGKVSKKGNKQK
jgi:hypothetical protein